MLEWLLAIVSVLLIVGVPLLALYTRERVKNLAREETDKVLADYRHQHERALAALNAQNQRRTQEFSLYAQEQHRVYAKLYRLVREASDRYSGMIGLTSGPDFEKYNQEEVQEYLMRREVTGTRVREILSMYEGSNRKRAAEVMDELHLQLNRRDAERAFIRAKNFEALYELYLSDPVRSQMNVVRSTMAKVSVTLMRSAEEGRDRQEFEKRETMEAAVAELYRVMRNELRRGYSDDQVESR